MHRWPYTQANTRRAHAHTREHLHTCVHAPNIDAGIEGTRPNNRSRENFQPLMPTGLVGIRFRSAERAGGPDDVERRKFGREDVLEKTGRETAVFTTVQSQIQIRSSYENRTERQKFNVDIGFDSVSFIETLINRFNLAILFLYLSYE